MNKTFCSKAALTLMVTALLGSFFASETAAQGGGCSNITYTLDNYQACCYRVQVNNSSECYTQLRILLDAGEFVELEASIQPGWSAQLVSPTEISLTHSSGIIPVGASIPISFCLPPDVSPTLTILWDYFCPLGEGCFAEFPLMGCSDASNASISGTVYRECGQGGYTNQPVLPGWAVVLADENGNLLSEQQTGADGRYAEHDLMAGRYIVKEIAQPGWTPNVPATGQALINLSPSENVVQNFGVCPSCSCDSIYLDVSQEEGISDTSTYNLTIANSQPFCFSFITIKVDSGQLISQQSLLPGWTVTLQGPNLLRLNPPGALVPDGATVPLRFRIGGVGAHQVVATAHWDNGLTNVACPRTFGYPGPGVRLPCACVGAIPGLNIVNNGNFTAGTFGFSSALSYSGSCGSNSYGVQTNFNSFCSGWPSLLDHTANTPPASRRYLIIDGERDSNQPTVLWKSAISLLPNTNYCFSFWWASIVPASQQSFPVSIDMIDNFTNQPISNLGTQTIAQTPAATWQQTSFNWHSGNLSGTRYIAIRQLTGAPQRDFGIDDICMREAQGCIADFSFQTNCLNAQFTNLSTPATGLTYLWNFGDNQTSTQPNPAHPYTACGTYTVCLTISGPGCAKQICKQVTIADNVPPVAVCVPSFGVTLTANCTYPVTAAAMDGGSTDNCPIASRTISPGLLTGCGFFPVTLTVTDQCNNTSTCTTTIQTIEVVPPVITCPPGFQQECNGNLPPSLTGTATATDNCTATSQIVITYTDLLFGTPSCADFVRRTWRAVDACGNSATCQQTISVHDDLPPLLSCPALVFINGTINAQGSCVATVTMTTPTATDNCSPTVTLTNSFNGTANASGTYPSGTTTVIWTGTDGCGNTATCPVTVTVTCSPCVAAFTFQALDNCGKLQFTSQSTGPAPLTYAWNFGDPGSGAGNNTSSLSNPMHQFSGCGTYNVCLTVFGNGCSTTLCKTVTVTDNVPPVAVCLPGFGVDLNANCSFAVTPGSIDGGSSDNCQLQSRSVSPSVLTGCGTFPVTLTVTDWCGNTSTCTTGIQTIEIVPPVVTCPANTTVNGIVGPTGCTAVFQPLPPTVSDNCDPAVSLSHNAPSLLQAGLNTVTWTAMDDCGNTTTCSVGVTVACSSCTCGTFSDLFARPGAGAPSIPLTCGGPPVVFGCPSPGFSIPITGKFACLGNSCAATSLINWTLTGPGGPHAGTVVAGPYFSLPILPSYYGQPGTYTLTLNGNCGGQPCLPCVIQFTVNCPEPCPCQLSDIQALQAAVNVGFAQALWSNNCQACFSPLALSDCETVTWHLNTANGPLLGTTTGNQSLCYNFTNSGSYTIIMVVSRVKADGSPCETFTSTKTVNLTCVPTLGCENSVFDNPTFNEGAVLGGLNSGGASTGWRALYGDPHVVYSDGTNANRGILLAGNLDSADVLSSIESMCLEKGSGTFLLRGTINTSRSNIKNISIFINRGDSFVFNVFNPASCFRIASIDVSQYDSSWFELEIPYDLSTWAALDSCGPTADGVLVRPIVYVTSFLGAGQGGEAAISEMTIDNFCIAPDACTCGTFSNTCIRSWTRIACNPVVCGGGAINLNCPRPGYAYDFTGQFSCQGVCLNNAPVIWQFSGPGGTFSGSTTAAPYFSIALLPTYFSLPGLYTLTLQGSCDGSVCAPCVFQFHISCPDACPCDPAALQAEVGQGFASVLSNQSCQGCFSAIALTDCDEVEWFVNNGSVGTSGGRQTFCYPFPNAGIYTVKMVVTRRKSDGTVCALQTYSRSVLITCTSWADCTNSVFDNPGFSEGAIAGGLNSGGAATGWMAQHGDPHEITQVAGSLDEWVMYLTGNLDSADVLSSIEPVCLKQDSGMVSLRLAGGPIPGADVKVGRKPPGGNVSLVLYQGNTLNVADCNNCYRLASVDGLLPLDSGEWVQIQIPYNLSNWAGLDSCGDGHGGVPVRIAVYVSSPLGTGQAGLENGYRAELDNLCVEGQLVAVKNPSNLLPLRIFPNPNSGTFRVELPAPARPGTAFRIVGLTGQVLRTQPTQAGSAMQAVQADDLPPGLYFLQVMAEGRVVAVEKFVKQ